MPIGRLKTTRSLPYLTAFSSATRPMPSASAAINIRSGLSPSRMYLKPLPSSPTRSCDRHAQVVDEHLVGADGVAAHLVDRPDVDVVAVEVGRGTSVMPSVFLVTSSYGVVRVSSRIFSDSSALEIHTFRPLTR